MQYDKELIAHKLDRWDRFITDYHLPEWDSIPDLGLYMDQVVVLLAQYLNFIPAMPGGKERYWDEVALRYFARNYEVVVRECTFDDVIEIDTYRELQELDKAYV